ncbi:MAG: hypothetical protein FJ215_05340 [Ignavibacteria bacterium]|nr:hypothetical protein [Ignavibacteria bacterium]
MSLFPLLASRFPRRHLPTLLIPELLSIFVTHLAEIHNICPILVISYLLFFLGGYLPGSFPTAYLLVRKWANLDIRSEGSGNVGGYNTYRVTGSSRMGTVVGLIDGAKGLIAVVGALLVGGDFWHVALALIGAIVGHNYSVWLKFRGGRGLATAAGGVLPIGVMYGVHWCIVWIVAKSLGRGILTANVFAVLLAPLLVYLTPDSVLRFFMTSNVPLADYRLLSVLLSVVLLMGHVNGIKEVVADLKGVQPEIENPE